MLGNVPKVTKMPWLRTTGGLHSPSWELQLHPVAPFSEVWVPSQGQGCSWTHTAPLLLGSGLFIHHPRHSLHTLLPYTEPLSSHRDQGPPQESVPKALGNLRRRSDLTRGQTEIKSLEILPITGCRIGVMILSHYAEWFANNSNTLLTLQGKC